MNLRNFIQAHPVGAIYSALALLGIGGTLFAVLLFDSPHMVTQQSVKTYEREKLRLPDGVVARPLWGDGTAAAAPAETTHRAVARGKTYYGYYCAFCHGPGGKGDGPVGKSYVPRPADLTSPDNRVSSTDDLRAVIDSTTGHAPVLERVIPDSFYPYLVMYVRTLASREQGIGP